MDVDYPFIYNVTNFQFPSSIMFGPNSLERIDGELKQFKGSKILIVTDKTMTSIGNVDKLLNQLEKTKFEIVVYDKVEPDPHIEIADEIISLTKKNGYDVIIGLGGGSSLDMAKIASISKYIEGSVEKHTGVDKIGGKGSPLICIPTTAGTGSEVTPFSVFTVKNKKKSIASKYIVPDLALVDPLLTFSMPPNITAGSGLDALSHAIEGMISIWSTPLTEALALAAIRLIAQYLRVAYFNGNIFEARCNMSLAATIAGLSFSSPRVTYGHSVAQTFAPVYNVPHGTSCAMTLPYIMEFYLPVSTSKIAQIAAAMGEKTQNKSLYEASKMAIHAVYKLSQDLNITGLKELGATREQLPMLAKACISDWPRTNTPRKFSEKSALKVFERMWIGKPLILE
jgi:alcohol dehydrogenase class IV